MKTIDRYIGRRLAWGWSLIALLLTSLFSITELVGELEEVGIGFYSAADAFLFVLLTVPGRLAGMAPVSALLGGLLALGMLSAGHELMAMEAAGVSLRRIALSVLRAGALLMAGVAVLVQFVAPPLNREAFSRRQAALSGAWTVLPSGGLWARDGSRFIRVGNLHAGLLPEDIDIYSFSPRGELLSFIQARTALIQGKDWVLEGVRETKVSAEGFQRSRTEEKILKVDLTLRQINLLDQAPEVLSPMELLQIVSTLRERGQNPDRYAWALWQKGTLPLKAGAMALFALPFFPGAMRQRGAGLRILLGTVAGIAFYFLDQSLGSLGILLGLPAPLVSLAPVALILGLALWMLARES